MKKEFWLKKWETGEIGFHRSETNPALIEYFSELSLPKGCRVFVPLCGKTLDVSWLLQQGYRVVGVELSEKAVGELFADLGGSPKKERNGNFIHFTSEGIDIFVGDIFQLTSQLLGAVDAVYDRAALIALPTDKRKAYASHCLQLTGAVPQLLLSFEYDQSLKKGPPFSVDSKEVNEHYEKTHEITLLESIEVPPRPPSRDFPALECVWNLRPLKQ